MSLVDNTVNITNIVKDINSDTTLSNNNTLNNSKGTLKTKNKLKNKKRCFNCKKKIGLLGFECSHCNKYYCDVHRLPEEHICNVDYKKDIFTSNNLGGGEFQKIVKI